MAQAIEFANITTMYEEDLEFTEGGADTLYTTQLGVSMSDVFSLYAKVSDGDAKVTISFEVATKKKPVDDPDPTVSDWCVGDTDGDDVLFKDFDYTNWIPTDLHPVLAFFIRLKITRQEDSIKAFSINTRIMKQKKMPTTSRY